MKYTVQQKFHGRDGVRYNRGDVVDDEENSEFLDLYLDSDANSVLSPFEAPSEALTSQMKKNQREKAEAMKAIDKQRADVRKMAKGGRPKKEAEAKETF